MLLWFEPERVREGTDLATQHPDWVTKIDGSPNYLFDLGNSEARVWLTDYICNFLKREGVDYYRQDFNMDPIPYWKAKDKPDRIGISEIRHIEGLYAYWDSLLVRFPELIIDNCASGGRRLDLETISRSSPLWRTDYQYGEPNGYQCHTYGLNYYLPLHGTGHYELTPYSFRSSMSSAIVLNWDINSSSGSIPEMRKYMNEFKRLRPYYYGDYYPLTGIKDITGDNVWLVYQLNRPEKQDGIVMAFRRDKALNETITVKLHGLEKDSEYELFYEDYGIKRIKKGSELMNSLCITISDRPSSLLISYKKHIKK
jgi:alpha-galactosidase